LGGGRKTNEEIKSRGFLRPVEGKNGEKKNSGDKKTTGIELWESVGLLRLANDEVKRVVVSTLEKKRTK